VRVATRLPSRTRPKNRDHLSAVLPTPPPSKSASDDGFPVRPKRVAKSTKSSPNDEAPCRVANSKDIALPAPYQSNNTTSIPTSTPATTPTADNASHQPGAAMMPRIQMFAKKPESSTTSKSKGGGMTNELRSLVQLNASMKSKRHVTTVYVPTSLGTEAIIKSYPYRVLPSSQPYSLPLVVGWDQRDVAARGLLDPYERSHPLHTAEEDSSNKSDDMGEEEKMYAEARKRLKEAERVERFHMQALILARNRTEEARRALEEQEKVYSLRSRLIR
jgi:hypothetical protein